MRSLFLAVALLLSPLRSGAEDDPNYWYAVTFNGGFATTRYAKAEYAETLRKDRQYCIVVTWLYAPEVEGNVDDLNPERDRADAAIASELDREPEAVIAAKTIGGYGMRWIIYAPKAEGIALGLERSLNGLVNSKGRIQVAKDVEWKVFARYVESLKEKP